MYIAYNNDGYITAYKTRTELIHARIPYNVAIEEFKVSGYNYQQKKHSARHQCQILLDCIEEYDYSVKTLLTIVGWIQRTANSFGLVRQLNKEEIKLWHDQ